MTAPSHQPPLFDAMQADAPEILGRMDDVADDPRVWPKSLAELVDVLVADAIERGIDEAQAIKESRRTIMLIAHYRGGVAMYLPRNEKLRMALRDQQIWLEFKGDNIQQLADKHGLTATMIYGILKYQRKLTIARKQVNLFPEKQ